MSVMALTYYSGIIYAAVMCSSLALGRNIHISRTTPVEVENSETVAASILNDSGASKCGAKKKFSLRLFEGSSPEPSDSDSKVVCNDGTPAGYYHRLETNGGRMTSDKWVIFLDGGQYCAADASCAHRYSTVAGKMSMSSQNWPLEKDFDGFGLLSSQVSSNPHLANANKIYVPYCSSDVWSGDMSADDVNATGTLGSGTLSVSNLVFMGSKIIRAVIADLVQRQSLAQASYVALAGHSAGGLGVGLHLDYLRNKLQLTESGQRKTQPIVQGLSAAAWYVPYTYCRDNGLPSSKCLPPDATFEIRLGAKRVWQSSYPPACLAQKRHDPFQCLFPVISRPYMQGDMIFLQWMYDQAVAELIRSSAQHLFQMSTGVANSLKETSRTITAPLSVSIVPVCVGHFGFADSDVWTGLKVKNGNCTVAQIVQSAYLFSKTGSRKASQVEGCRFRRHYGNTCTNPLRANPTCPGMRRDDSKSHSHSLQIASLPQVISNRNCGAALPGDANPSSEDWPGSEDWLNGIHP
ncbi:carboxylesterase notum2-like [Sycon ciliatum]|uniref:carboxylesterase notum2-like n=1 Tax=Sycon ciliatum TaxID=27933 RepID=UPI0031F70731